MLQNRRIRGAIVGLACLSLLIPLCCHGAQSSTPFSLRDILDPAAMRLIRTGRHADPIIGHELPTFLRKAFLEDRPGQGSGPEPDKQLTGNAENSTEREVATPPLDKVARVVFISNGVDEWVNDEQPPAGTPPPEPGDPLYQYYHPDGLIDAYGTASDGYNIWIMRHDGTEQVMVKSIPDPTNPHLHRSIPGDEHDPAYDPGATVLAFANDQTGTYQIYTMDILTRTVRQITYDAGSKSHPTWSADGRWIAYATDVNGATNRDIFEVSARGVGSALPLAVTPVDESEPTFQPNGLSILYTRADGAVTHIWQMDPNGANQQQLTDGGGDPAADDRSPAWRQDGIGNQFAFASNRLTDPALDSFRDYNIWSVGVAGELLPGPGAVLYSNTNPADRYDDLEPAYSPLLAPIPPVGPDRAPTRIFFSSNRLDAPEVPVPQSEWDIWAAILLDDRPPVLLALPSVSNRNPSPGDDIVVYAQPYDDETGVAVVRAFFKDPDSAEDDSQRIDHKQFIEWFTDFEPNAYPGRYLEEIDCETVGSIQLFDDGDMPNHGDAVADDGTFSGIWTTPAGASRASDFIIDIGVTDNSGNAIIFDDIYGFSTVAFAPKTNVLLVDDYCEGQQFLSQPGATGRDNDLPASFPCESYFTTNYSEADALNSWNIAYNTFYGGINALGQRNARDSYRVGFIGVDGEAYDLWRIICRGAPDLQTLTYYAPTSETQLTTDLKGLRQVPVANRAIFWAAPHTGDVWTADGTLTDAATQALLQQFVARGGRLCVTGQDIAWALTLDGTVSNPFLATVLGASYVRDDNTGRDYLFNPTWDIGGVPGDLLADDPWWPHTHYGDGMTNEWDGGPDAGDNTLADMDHLLNNKNPDAYWWAIYPDVIRPSGATQIYGYGGATAADGAGVKREDPTTGARVVYFAFPFEAIDRHYHSTNSVAHCRNKRSKLAHQTLCWLRTGGLQGRVLGAPGLQPLRDPEPIVTIHPLNQPDIILYAQRCLTDGTFTIAGLPPAIYEVQARRPGYWLDKPEYEWVHGGLTPRVVDFVVTLSQPGAIQGTVTSLADGQPIANVTVTAVSTDPDATTPIASVLTGADGTYVISNVPVDDYDVTADGSTATPPYGSDTKKVTVIPGSSVTQDFQLEAADGTLEVTVTDAATHALLEGATVKAMLNRALVGSATTDTTGVATLQLPPGTYALTVDKPGYAQGTTQATVLSAQVVVVSIALTALPPGAIAGQVYRSSNVNDPIGGVTVEVIVGSSVIARVQTADQWTYSPGGQNRYNYKIDTVPAGGGVVVRASASGFTVTPASQTVTVATGVVTYDINFMISALHSFPTGLQFISVPFDYSTQDPAVVVGTPVGQTLRMAAWDPALGRYAIYPAAPADRLRLGMGYWLRLAQPQDLVSEGTRAGNPYYIPLGAGWNGIGDPFTSAVDFYSLRVRDSRGVERTIQEAFAAGQVRNGLFVYGLGGYSLATSLLPYSGYWIYAGQPVSLVVADPAQPALSAAAARTVERPALAQPKNGWLAPIVVSAAGLTDASAAFGVAPGADEILDVPKPPAPQGGYVYASFASRGEATKAIDVRGAGNQKWTLVVQSTAGKAPVTVSWPDLSQLPLAARPMLRDPVTGQRQFMRDTQGYTFRPKRGEARRLQIEVSDAPQGTLTVTTVGAQSARRGATVTYTLSRDAQVTVEVRNVAGRTIARPGSPEPRSAGRNVATWGGRTDAGVAAPAGRYLVRITARSADGQQASALIVVTTGG